MTNHDPPEYTLDDISKASREIQADLLALYRDFNALHTSETVAHSKEIDEIKSAHQAEVQKLKGRIHELEKKMENQKTMESQLRRERNSSLDRATGLEHDLSVERAEIKRLVQLLEERTANFQSTKQQATARVSELEHVLVETGKRSEELEEALLAERNRSRAMEEALMGEKQINKGLLDQIACKDRELVEYAHAYEAAKTSLVEAEKTIQELRAEQDSEEEDDESGGYDPMSALLNAAGRSHRDAANDGDSDDDQKIRIGPLGARLLQGFPLSGLGGALAAAYGQGGLNDQREILSGEQFGQDGHGNEDDVGSYADEDAGDPCSSEAKTGSAAQGQSLNDDQQQIPSVDDFQNSGVPNEDDEEGFHTDEDAIQHPNAINAALAAQSQPFDDRNQPCTPRADPVVAYGDDRGSNGYETEEEDDGRDPMAGIYEALAALERKRHNATPEKKSIASGKRKCLTPLQSPTQNDSFDDLADDHDGGGEFGQDDGSGGESETGEPSGSNGLVIQKRRRTQASTSGRAEWVEMDDEVEDKFQRSMRSARNIAECQKAGLDGRFSDDEY